MIGKIILKMHLIYAWMVFIISGISVCVTSYCHCGLTDVSTGQLLTLLQMVSEPQPPQKKEEEDPFTVSHKVPVHFSRLTGALMQPPRRMRKAFKSLPGPAAGRAAAARMCPSRSSSRTLVSSQIFANRCEEGRPPCFF